jgi:type I restriction enzyme R subunit
LRSCPRKERCNIVVIADEAHRSQYDFIDGFAKHMRDALPTASFIGFTGTPIGQVSPSLLTLTDFQRFS